MSLSDLGSQLASLNNLKYSTSTKTQDEALVGRGSGFKANLGHVQESSKAKPSILMSEREAADVPLITIREQCEQSLKNLKLSSRFAKVMELNVSERKLLTKVENQALDGNIREMLNWLSTLACGDSAVDCLHVLEYLIRGFEIHERRATATWLITCFLPYHEAPFFQRVLQLVDLADIAASAYIFLRPYVGSKPGSGLDRRIISKQVSKDDGLMGLILELAQNAASTYCAEGEEADNTINNLGVSRILSFAAAVLIEAFEMTSTSLREQTVRVVLPYIASACGNNKSNKNYSEEGEKCAEYRHFGYIVSVAIAQRCTLSNQLKEVLTASIVKGSIVQNKKFIESDQGDSLEAMECAVDGLLTVLNVLLKGRRDVKDKKDLMAVTKTKYQGCVLPHKTFLLLCRHKLFVPALGAILESRQDLQELLSNFLSALLASSVEILGDRKEGSRCGVDVFNNLAQESTLKPLLKDLARPTMEFLINSFAKHDGKETDLYVIKNFKHVISSLRTIETASCDSGIAELLSNNSSKKKFMKSVGKILSTNSDALPSSSSNLLSHLLPARVALEHSDANTRLSAISRLVAQSEESLKAKIKKEDPFDPKGGESIAEALLRRVTLDNDGAVVFAAATAFVKLGKLSCHSTFTILNVDNMVNAITKWSVYTEQWRDEPLQSDIICSILTMSSLIQFSLDNPHTSDLVICILSHLLTTDSHFFSPKVSKNEAAKISKAALMVLCKFFDLKESNKGNKFLNNLAKSPKLLECIKQSYAQNSDTQLLKRMKYRAYMLTLSSCAFLMQEKKSHENMKDILFVSVNGALKLLHSYGKSSDASNDLVQNEVNFIKNALMKCVEKNLIPMKSSVIADFCSVTFSFAFEEACMPVLRELMKDRETSPVPLLMSTAMSATQATPTLRLLNLAAEKVVSEKMPTLGLVYSLALIGSSEEHIRKGALNYMNIVGNMSGVKKKEERVVIDFYNTLDSSFRTDIEMDGTSALPRFLVRALGSMNNAALFRTTLLHQCRDASFGEIDRKEESFDKWTPISRVFAAMEVMGNDYFPLNEKWDCAGFDILTRYCQSDLPKVSLKSDGLSEELPVENVMSKILYMMKGIKGNSSNTLSVISGPSERRVRSYSLGSDEQLFLSPYPSSMAQAIIDCLSVTFPVSKVQISVLRNIIGSTSWSKHIYSKLDDNTKNTIAKNLFLLRLKKSNVYVEQAILGLTVSSKELVHLLEDFKEEFSNIEQRSKRNLALVVISDIIQARAPNLSAFGDLLHLESLMIDELLLLSSREESDRGVDSNGIEYTRVSILKALSSLVKDSELGSTEEETKSPTKKSKKKSKAKVKADKDSTIKCCKLLVDLLGASTTSESILPLVSARAKEIAVSLLSSLCSRSPSDVVPFVSTAISQVVFISTSFDDDVNEDIIAYKDKITRDALYALVPLFFNTAHLAKLSFLDLIKNILIHTNSLDTDHDAVDGFYLHFQSALEQIHQDSQASASLLASLTANSSYFAINGEDYPMDTDKDEVESVSHLLLRQMPDNVSVILQLIRSLSGFFTNLNTGSFADDEVDNNVASQNGLISPTITCPDIAAIAVYGPESKSFPSSSEEKDAKSKKSIMLLVTELLNVIGDGLSTSTAKRIIKSRSDLNAKLSLQLWKDLMQLHAQTLEYHADECDEPNAVEEKFWTVTTRAIQDCLDKVQRHLPTPHFLVSVTTLLQEKDGHLGLQRRALRLLVDRSMEIDPTASIEAALYLETIPELTSLLKSNFTKVSDNADDVTRLRRDIVLYQAVLIAIEQIAGHLCPVDIKSKQSPSKEECAVLIPSMERIYQITEESMIRIQDIVAEDENPMIHLVSTSALVLATLVSILKARSLPFLPKLVKLFLSSLTFANASLSNEVCSFEGQTILKQLQKSIIRYFIATIQSLPQFIGPYLNSILSSTTFLSSTIRCAGLKTDTSMSSLVSHFDECLAENVPSRLLLPAVCNVVETTLLGEASDSNWLEASAALGVMNTCLQSTASRSDVSSGSIMIKIIGAIIAAFSYDSKNKDVLLSVAIKTLLSLVMKLSETQLRSLYARIREWRGDIVEGASDDVKSSISRRYAFWSVTTVLSKELRGIFLPCMSSVVSDLVDELEFATSKLCITSSKKSKKDGSKRRRTSLSIVEELDTIMKPFQKVLSSLENALKSDAHNGGEWVRADDSQRYNQILKPLSKLMHANVNRTLYKNLIQGEDNGEDGNVCNCLLALATAAGNEQLWKPLNHAILLSCGHDSRSEIRNAGVGLLLKVLQTLGEEYMVLLPECLPVLSELLEDTDEAISGMAKECVQLGEDLLGEELAL